MVKTIKISRQDNGFNLYFPDERMRHYTNFQTMMGYVQKYFKDKKTRSLEGIE